MYRTTEKKVNINFLFNTQWILLTHNLRVLRLNSFRQYQNRTVKALIQCAAVWCFSCASYENILTRQEARICKRQDMQCPSAVRSNRTHVCIPLFFQRIIFVLLQPSIWTSFRVSCHRFLCRRNIFSSIFFFYFKFQKIQYCHYVCVCEWKDKNDECVQKSNSKLNNRTTSENIFLSHSI